MRNARRAALAIAAVLTAGGCDAVGPGETLGQFEWSELDDGPVNEFSDFTVIGREIVLLGELNTPTPCYRLRADVAKTSSRITVRIDGTSTGSPNCGEETGSFRYSGLLRDVQGFDELRVIHDITGGETTEFVHDLTVEQP